MPPYLSAEPSRQAAEIQDHNSNSNGVSSGLLRADGRGPTSYYMYMFCAVSYGCLPSPKTQNFAFGAKAVKTEFFPVT